MVERHGQVIILITAGGVRAAPANFELAACICISREADKESLLWTTDAQGPLYPCRPSCAAWRGETMPIRCMTAPISGGVCNGMTEYLLDEVQDEKGRLEVDRLERKVVCKSPWGDFVWDSSQRTRLIAGSRLQQVGSSLLCVWSL